MGECHEHEVHARRIPEVQFDFRTSIQVHELLDRDLFGLRQSSAAAAGTVQCAEHCFEAVLTNKLEVRRHAGYNHGLSDRLANGEVPNLVEIAELVAHRDETEDSVFKVSVGQQEKDAGVDELGSEHELHHSCDHLAVEVIPYLLNQVHVEDGDQEVYH